MPATFLSLLFALVVHRTLSGPGHQTPGGPQHPPGGPHHPPAGSNPSEWDAGSNSTDFTEEVDGIGVKFSRGKGGKGFEIYRTRDGNRDSHKVRFEIDDVREVDVDGKAVGKRADPPHRLKLGDEDTEFAWEHEAGVAVGDDGAEAHRVSFSSSIENLGSFRIDTFLFIKEGEVGPNATKWDAFIGDLKWNIEFSEWSWCGDDAICEDRGQQEVGAYIDVDIEMMGPSRAGRRAGKGGKGRKYELGGGIDIDLTTEMEVDGEAADMPDGYPLIEQRGPKQIFTFRFPKFANSSSYDPLMRTGAMGDSPWLTNGAHQAGAVACLVLLIASFSFIAV